MQVSVVQLTSTDNVEENQKIVMGVLNQLPDSDVVVFPENTFFLRLDNSKKIQGMGLEDAVFQPLQEWARSRNTLLLIGSVPLKVEGKLFNSTVGVFPDGEVKNLYQKIHLFDVDLDDGTSYRESKDFSPGTEPETMDHLGWRWGLSICFDLRFSDLYSRYRKLSVDILFVPAAFTVPTGEAHWKTLLRARAIESQCFVIAPAQWGNHKGKRKTYGHSLVISPWGKVIAEIKDGETFVTVDLDKSEIERVRRQIPMK